MLNNILEYKFFFKRHSNKNAALLGLSTIIDAVNNLNNLIKNKFQKGAAITTYFNIARRSF